MRCTLHIFSQDTSAEPREIQVDLVHPSDRTEKLHRVFHGKDSYFYLYGIFGSKLTLERWFVRPPWMLKLALVWK